MTPPLNLLDLLKQTASALDRENIPYAVSGGLAVMLWGVVRATRDMDLLISVPATRLPRALEIMFELGCSGNVMEVLKRLRKDHFAVLDCGGIEVEVFTPLLPYHHKVLERRVRKDIEGVPIYFVSAEDLVVLKVLFNRTKDIADVKGILATQKGRLDTAYIIKTLKELLPASDARLTELDLR